MSIFIVNVCTVFLLSMNCQEADTLKVEKELNTHNDHSNQRKSFGLQSSLVQLSDHLDVHHPTYFKRRGGPHLCHRGHLTTCCPGWKSLYKEGPCIKAQCRNNCGEGGFCVRPNWCHCYTGRESVSCYSNTENEGNHYLPSSLSMLSFRCQELKCNQQCLEGYGSVSPGCACYRGFYLDVDRKSCVDVNECEVLHPCHQICYNFPGSYRCSCQQGYQLHANGHSCLDTDECASDFRSHCDGDCFNTIGSYFCSYSEGHSDTDCIHKGSVGQNCCRGHCSKGAQCVDGECVCPVGLTGFACGNDIDECYTLGFSEKCQFFCENTFGSFKCFCPSGYTLNSDFRTCQKIQCLPDCLNGGTCLNGSCICPPGYTGTSCDLDVNECVHVPPPCEFTCRNTFGGYVCFCPPGQNSHSSCSFASSSNKELRKQPRKMKCKSEDCKKMGVSTELISISSTLSSGVTESVIGGNISFQDTLTLSPFQTKFTTMSSKTSFTSSSTSTLENILLSTPVPAHKFKIPIHLHKSITDFENEEDKQVKFFLPPNLTILNRIGYDNKRVKQLQNNFTEKKQQTTIITDMKNITAETKLIGKKKENILEKLVTDNEEEILKSRLNGEDKRTSAPKLSSKKKETPETKLGSRTVKSSETKLSSRKKQMASENKETLKNTSTSKKEETKLSNRKEITPEKELTIKEDEVPEILFNIEKKQKVEKVIPLTQENSTKSMIMQKLDIPARKEKILKMDIFTFEGIKAAVVPDCFYIGRRVKSGTKFFLDSSNCTKCSCQLGELRCETKMCQPLPCSNPLPGPCCHYCPEDCLFEEEIFGHNQTFIPDFDPCRKCICKNGQVYCDAVVCPILECETSSQVIPAGQCCATCQETKPTMCLYKGKHFYVGQLWLQHNKESCRSCLCKEGGVVECRVVVCFPQCSYPEKVPTNCCPVCSGCQYLNQTYADGEVFSEPSNVCNTCVCQGGNVTCTKKQCDLPCQHPYHQLGHCCPVCSDCTFEGEHIPNSETVFIAGQECQLCTCKYGNVSCEPVPCPADCILSGTVDFTYRHGNIFQPEADPCVQCICLNGSISCFVTSCEKDCDHGIYSQDQCCSNCDACEYKGAIHSNGETFLSIEGEDCKKCSCKLGTVHCEEETCRKLDCPVKHREQLPNSCCSVCSNYTSQ